MDLMFYGSALFTKKFLNNNTSLFPEPQGQIGRATDEIFSDPIPGLRHTKYPNDGIYK
jgi:hypothetical protein